MVELVPITQKNLSDLAQVGASFNIPRSVGWLRRALFNPNAASCDENARRGYLLHSDLDGYVGMLCYYPTCLYLRQSPRLAYSGCMMGVKPKYGEWLMDLFKAVISDEHGCFTYGNTSCSARATKVCRLIRGDKIGPRLSEFSNYSFIGLSGRLFGWVHSVVKRGKPSSLFWICFKPFSWMEGLCRWLAWRDGEFVVRRGFTFSDAEFMPFWDSFLKGNDGLISSREPATLRHYFDDSLKADKAIMFAAKQRGVVRGYIVMRRYSDYMTLATKYKIVDLCAVGNDMTCMKALVDRAKLYALCHNGTRMEYIGGNPGIETLMHECLPHREDLGHATTTYFNADAEIESAFAEGRGWFFGPYDGERCLGHGSYLDL